MTMKVKIGDIVIGEVTLWKPTRTPATPLEEIPLAEPVETLPDLSNFVVTSPAVLPTVRTVTGEVVYRAPFDGVDDVD